MLVVIVLAVLLAVCICIFVAVFCWFRKKSERRRRKAKSSRNPSEQSTATRPVPPQDQSNLTNAYTEGVQIVSRDAVLYDVPVDDIDYPRTGTHTKDNLYSTDLSAYSDVHDAIQPSAKLNTNYNDDENHYLNPVDTPPTLDAKYYAKVELNLKPFQNMTTKDYKNHHKMEKAVADPSAKQQGYLKDATNNEPVTCSSLYATAELNSKPSKAPNRSSKRDLEQQYENVVTNEAASCNSLYATTDLSSKEYRDGAERTQHMDDTTSAPCYYNNLYASTDLKYLQHQATNEGLQRNSNGCLKEDKPRGCQTEAGNSGNTKSRHPSIGSIMSASRKSYPTPSIPPLYKQPKQDTMMYAMVDLLDKDEELNMLNTQVDKKDKKRKK